MRVRFGFEVISNRKIQNLRLKVVIVVVTGVASVFWILAWLWELKESLGSLVEVQVLSLDTAVSGAWRDRVR